MGLKNRASDQSGLSEAIAVMAHQAWCRRMIEDGWSPGAAFSETDRTHDALGSV